MPAYLHIEGVPGKNLNPAHPDHMVFTSFSWGIEQTGAAPLRQTLPGLASPPGGSRFPDLAIIRQIDEFSPAIYGLCASGKHIEEVTVGMATIVKSSVVDWYVLTLGDVVFTSVHPHLTAAGDPLPTEEITLAYGRIGWSYIPVNPQTGAAGTPIKGGWDQASRRAM